MRRDPTEFRKRFAAYKLGKSPYLAGRPVETDDVILTDYQQESANKVFDNVSKYWGTGKGYNFFDKLFHTKKYNDVRQQATLFILSSDYMLDSVDFPGAIPRYAREAKEWNLNWIRKRMKDPTIESNKLGSNSTFKLYNAPYYSEKLDNTTLDIRNTGGGSIRAMNADVDDNGNRLDHNRVVLYNEGLNIDDAVHEFAHSLGYNLTYHRMMNEKFRDLLPPKSSLVNGEFPNSSAKDYWDYIKSPDEIYARRNSFLHSIDADPLHKWTLDEIKNLRDKWDNHELTKGYRNMTDEELMWLFNEIAYNQQPSNSDTYYAYNNVYDKGKLPKINYLPELTVYANQPQIYQQQVYQDDVSEDLFRMPTIKEYVQQNLSMLLPGMITMYNKKLNPMWKEMLRYSNFRPMYMPKYT